MKVVVATTSYPRTRAMHSGIFVAQWRAALEARGLSTLCLRPQGSIGYPKDIEYRIWGDLLKGGGAPDMLSRHPLRGTMTAAIQSLSLAHQVQRHGDSGDLFVGHWLLPWGLFLPHKVPCHLYAHGSDIALLETMPLGLGRRVVKRIDTSATGITFVSSHLRDRYIHLLGHESTCALSTIPMGVYECEYEPTLYNELVTFKGQRTLAVAMGRHVRLKGLDVLLQSARNIPSFCIAVGGSGPETSALMALSQNLNVDVKWIGEFNPQQREALLAAADIFVQPSRQIGKRQEGAPVTLLEAINHGVPCLASQTKGHLDLVHRGVLETFPDGDIHALHELLHSFAADEHYQHEQKYRAASFRHTLSWRKHIGMHMEQLLNSARQSV